MSKDQEMATTVTATGDINGADPEAGAGTSEQVAPAPHKVRTKTKDGGRKKPVRPRHKPQAPDCPEMSIEELTRAVRRHNRTLRLHSKTQL